MPSLLADMFATCTLYTGVGLTFHGTFLVTGILWPRLLGLPR